MSVGGRDNVKSLLLEELRQADSRIGLIPPRSSILSSSRSQASHNAVRCISMLDRRPG